MKRGRLGEMDAGEGARSGTLVATTTRWELDDGQAGAILEDKYKAAVCG